MQLLEYQSEIEVMGEETMSDQEEVIIEKVTCSSILRRANAFITEGVRKLLYKHGYVVGHYPLIFAILPLLITGLLTLGVLKFKADQDVRNLFTPIDAPSHTEFEKVQQYFDDEGSLYELALFFRAKDGGSVIRPQYLDRVIELTKYFNDNFTIFDQQTDRTWNFGRDLKINHDQEYGSLLEGLTAIKYAVSRADQSSWLNTTTLVMPTARGNVYMGNILSNVTRRRLNSSHTVIDVQCLRIMYRSACGDPEHCRLLKQWTTKFLEQDKILIDDLVSFWPWNDYLLSVELLRVSTTLIPYVIVSFLILIFFAICASLTDSIITSKPWEALAGVTSVGLAVASSFGTIFLLNYSFVGTLAVMPVLVLAMGLDVTFIVLRNWQSTNPELDVPSRLAETWGESGTSVIITSLTNIMSTCIGMITDTPAIRTFCLSTTVAVLFLFIYQITFFAAAIAIGGRRESKNRNAFLSCLPAKPNVNSSTARKQPLEPRRSLEFPTPVHRTLSRTLSTSSNSSSKTVSKFQRQETVSNQHVSRGQIVAARILNDDWWYKISQKLAAVLCNMYCRFVVLIILIVYWLTAVYGCLHIELGLSPEKLFLEDSAVLYSVQSDKTYILLNVFIQKPPDFTNETEEKTFFEMKAIKCMVFHEKWYTLLFRCR
uniref:SSD domain-containing protein n=1 Tax=Romanomermis culicivorax TaxID=13658 RepID=A0A915KYH8_ROMCU